MQRSLMLPIIDAIVSAVSNIFNWMSKKEENYKIRKEDKRLDAIRKEREENEKKISDWASNDRP